MNELQGAHLSPKGKQFMVTFLCCGSGCWIHLIRVSWENTLADQFGHVVSGHILCVCVYFYVYVYLSMWNRL